MFAMKVRPIEARGPHRQLCARGMMNSTAPEWKSQYNTLLRRARATVNMKKATAGVISYRQGRKTWK